MANVMTVTPVPAAIASIPSRSLREAELCLAGLAGRYRRHISRSTIVTTSTVSCVSARSGALNRKNVNDTIVPATLKKITASSRLCRRNTVEHAPNTRTAKAAADAAIDRQHRERADQRRATIACQFHFRPRPGAGDHQEREEQRQIPLQRPRVQQRHDRARKPRRGAIECARTQQDWSATTRTAPAMHKSVCRRVNCSTPSPKATTVIASGRLKPCHTASLISGTAPGSTLQTLPTGSAPTTTCGMKPTISTRPTSTSTGRRIHIGGSCGVFGIGFDGTVEEHVPHEAYRIGNAKHTADRCDHR